MNNKSFKLKKIFVWIFFLILKLCSPFILKFEQRLIKTILKKKNKFYEPIFIIGSPRSGSTILYQLLTNRLDVLYINNLTCLIKNFIFGFWLSNKIFNQRAHNCFKSNFGKTKGLNAPSECGSFWYRWLPTSKHFIDHNEISKKVIRSIKKEISYVSCYFKKPIVFKNLNAGQRLRMICKAFPNAKIIFIRRDPLYTAQSIIKAKRKLNIKEDLFWSIMPSNVDELKELKSPEQIVKQIYYLEKQIINDLKLFKKENVFSINYSKLDTEKFNNLIKKLKIRNRAIFKNPKIEVVEKQLLSHEEIYLIKKEINKMNWPLSYVE